MVIRLALGFLALVSVVGAACVTEDGDSEERPAPSERTVESTASAAQDEAPAAPTPPATRADTGGVEILSFNSYTDSIGALHVVGEVENTSNSTAYDFVEVIATALDTGGAVLDTDFTFTSLDVLRPGDRSPFEVIFIDAPAGASRIRVQVDPSVARSPGAPAPLRISGTRDFVDSIGYRHIVGEVTNTGSGTLDFVQIIATLYNTAGEVVATDFTFSSVDTLGAGQSSPFEIIVLDTAGPASRYALVAQAG